MLVKTSSTIYKNAVEKGLQSAYIGRKLRKRQIPWPMDHSVSTQQHDQHGYVLHSSSWDSFPQSEVSSLTVRFLQDLSYESSLKLSRLL